MKSDLRSVCDFNQRPRIEFDDLGVCGACRVAELKQKSTEC